MKSAPLDVISCTGLAHRAAQGDVEALDALAANLWPAWIKMVESDRSIRALPRTEDHGQNVAATLLAKLKKRQGHALRLYLLWAERHADKTFLDWMRITTKNAVRNYVAARLGPRASLPDDPSPKRLLNEAASSELLDELGARPAVTAAQTARELLDFAETQLPRDQWRALALWLEGATFDEIASELGVDDAQASRLQRSAVAVLRRKFGQPTVAKETT